MLWNRTVGRRRPVDGRALTTRLLRLESHLRTYRQVPWWQWLTAAYGRVLLDAATLWACFQLVGGGVSPGQVLTGYGLLLLTSLLSALPGGLGLSDASLPVVFSQLGVPGPVALAAPLLYRLLSAWLWRLTGAVMWLVLEARDGVGQEPRRSAEALGRGPQPRP